MVVTKLGFKSSLFLQLAVKKHSEGKEIMSGSSSVGGYLRFVSMHEAAESRALVISVFSFKVCPIITV